MSKQRYGRGTVVSWTLRASFCDECGERLGKGRFFGEEGDLALFLTCADLDHLALFGSGNTGISHRARKHRRISYRCSVQPGAKAERAPRVLVEDDALARGKAECLQHHEAPIGARMTASLRRENWGKQLF